jgi:hypothetical protein
MTDERNKHELVKVFTGPLPSILSDNMPVTMDVELLTNASGNAITWEMLYVDTSREQAECNRSLQTLLA